MMRFITPIILIIISITLFFSFTNPLYNDISSLKTEVTSYNEALDNSKALENERDKLTAKYNAISPDNLMKLQKLLPDNVDNIRLILEIEQIALPYGMVLRDVKYNVTNTDTTTPANGVVQGGGAVDLANKDYGIFDLEFSVSGSYDNFINFTKDLESNLRIVDISSIDFSSDNVNVNAKVNSKTPSPEVYKYDFKIKTYWLKN
jgi:Tfp pilus assembly protein PilO